MLFESNVVFFIKTRETCERQKLSPVSFKFKVKKVFFKNK